MNEDMELNIDLDVLEIESAEEYHAQAKHYLSSHQLLDFMKCPWLQRKKALGLIGDADSSSFLMGRAAHVRVLEGREIYKLAFAIGGPTNPQTGKPYGANTQAFRAWAEEQSRPVLSLEQAELVEQMASGVGMNSEAVDLLLYGRSEGVVRADYCGTPCQARIDWLHPHRGIVDLKTCDDITLFEADAKRYGYHRQVAFYQSVLAQVLDGLMVPVHLIAVEKKEPFRCGVWRVTDDALAIARQENEAAIRKFLMCRRQVHWPTGYESIRMLNVA
jgi:hypothetical protein